MVVMHNHTGAPYSFSHGDKITQLFIQKVELPEITEASSLSEIMRGKGGFGSTGE
jgi:dUTP pyrophosphatase